MKILHIFPDDKFCDNPIRLFEQTGYENEYVCMVDEDWKEFKIIKNERVKPIYKSQSDILLKREDIDVYVFHSIASSYYDYVLSIPLRKKIIVVSWGWDIYCNQGYCQPICHLNLYKKKTQKLLDCIEKDSRRKKKESKWMLLKHQIKKIVCPNGFKEERDLAQKQKNKQAQVLQRIDYWSPILPSEYELLKKNKNFKSKLFPSFYSAFDIKSYEFKKINFYETRYLLIGNSADPSNNHIDILKTLHQRKFKEKLYFPLAYGNVNYRDYLITYLKENNVDCSIQKDLIDKREYMQVIKKCRVGIFGHIRQQALGNIYECLKNGMKVFLYRDSVTYKYLKSIGFIVFCIEKDLYPCNVNTPLMESEIEHNRSCFSYLDDSLLLTKIKQLLG